jgi:adenosylmethionine-8-amino-7-oxononanoate aminotransferase
MQQRFVDKGVWIRPFRNLVYIMPPYVINTEELGQVTNAIIEVIKEEKE